MYASVAIPTASLALRGAGPCCAAAREAASAMNANASVVARAPKPSPDVLELFFIAASSGPILRAQSQRASSNQVSEIDTDCRTPPLQPSFGPRLRRRRRLKAV